MIGSMTKKPLFTCTGYCRFDDCQVQVNVKVKVESESSLKAVVCFQGGIVRHSLQQLRRRPIRAEERQLIADTLSSKLPRSVYLQSLNKLEETVLQSGCRDEVPTTGVLKTISWGEREKQRRHGNEMVSLPLMSEDVQDKDDQWIQKVILQPKGVMLWSKRTIRLFHDRSKEDIVYLYATGSIVKKAKGESTPFYIYELVVRNPVKGCSPVPVATYVTCEHTTASITYFLGSFITDCVKQHGPKIRRRPVMFLCDGSVVLMQAMAHNLCGLSLNELLSQYYHIVTGQGKEHALALTILHRCLSHVMKNAKDLCKKHAAKHYRLCMHVFGLMTQATTLKELDQVVVSATVLLASPCGGENVEKHFKDLQTLLTAVAQPVIDDSGIAEEDFVNDLGPTPFDYHFKDVIQQASLDKVGEPNEYFCPNFIPKLLKYFLPQAALWSRLLLGDLGRHGRGPFYEKLSKRFKRVAQKSTQNYTKDNMTQRIMEKLTLHTCNIVADLTSMWKRKDSEVVVAVLPSHIRGNNLLIHHSELRTLRPHQWLTGEVIEGLFHLGKFQRESRLGKCCEKSTGILQDEEDLLWQGGLGTVKWRGATMHHPVQRDGSSCGVIVTMMARAVMEAFPALPVMSFGTSKKEMACERRKFALSILNGSVFNMENNCAMCSASKPPGSGPPTTDWMYLQNC
ncbi:120.7 kDa protein in NOF-FB transposable element [Dissostichus eleginoides]|uniref:120.7 kDa protein in NOF-FB transposable element n=1 Tax=Dissostichus eleginoides TaxID=100907 RepID=A0AAD9CC08_DISEL|nr:120.7 kDa protein in NOF-FB transposable element [Dissostichus eleginoides]